MRVLYNFPGGVHHSPVNPIPNNLFEIDTDIYHYGHVAKYLNVDLDYCILQEMILYVGGILGQFFSKCQESVNKFYSFPPSHIFYLHII